MIEALIFIACTGGYIALTEIFPEIEEEHYEDIDLDDDIVHNYEY